MDPEERAHFNLKAGLGGQSKSIYQRIIKKVYGKDLGPDIIRAIHENPVVALPIVVERLKAKDDEWKKAQREWNRVWREQDAKNFYKALDHQGVQFKQNDKKTLAAKSLIAEVEARRREQTNTRAALVDPSAYRIKPQFEFEFKDIEVVKDVLKLVISYLDRVNNALSPSDKERIERQLRDFVPLLLMLDKDDFDAEFGDAEHGSDEQDGSEDSDGDISMADDDETSSVATGKRGKKAPSDLRKRLLKQAGDKEAREQRGSTMTPGPEEAAAATEAPTADGRSHEGTPATENGDRAETPLPVPDDPAAVAEAVEKDRADADASEQTWVQIDVPEGSEQTSEVPEPKPKLTRKANFFANNHFYVLIRLIQVGFCYEFLLAPAPVLMTASCSILACSTARTLPRSSPRRRSSRSTPWPSSSALLIPRLSSTGLRRARTRLSTTMATCSRSPRSCLRTRSISALTRKPCGSCSARRRTPCSPSTAWLRRSSSRHRPSWAT
jgi:paired amphipathic helix protein Sin3a